MPAPIVIGITGGIGAGKSSAVDAFVRRGAVAFSADAAVHELYARPDVQQQVRDRWGDDVIRDGRIDRSAIAAIVFHDPEERAWLEQLLHPLVGEAWLRFIDEQRALPAPPRVIVAEVPLLFEAGLEDRYDAIIAITAPLPTRMSRVGERASGRTLSAQRAAVQMPEEEKVARADIVFENTGSLDDLERFADDVLDRMQVASPQ